MNTRADTRAATPMAATKWTRPTTTLPSPTSRTLPSLAISSWQMAVTSLLVEKGIFSADEMRAQIERMDTLDPARGAELVARAWTDDGFRERLVADSKAAAAELGMDIGPIPILVMENTPDTQQPGRVHPVLVLSAVPPRIPPDWYKSRSSRSRAVREPRAVLAEFGTEIAADVDHPGHDSTADMRYMGGFR